MRPNSQAALTAASHAETAEPSDTPEPSETAEPSDSAGPSDSHAPSGPAAPASPSPDTHGALVSTAAHMSTPTGFPNHGAFVSCVAHLNASAIGFVWSTVTPASCGITASATPKALGNRASTNGATHGAAGKAKAAAARAGNGSSH